MPCMFLVSCISVPAWAAGIAHDRMIPAATARTACFARFIFLIGLENKEAADFGNQFYLSVRLMQTASTRARGGAVLSSVSFRGWEVQGVTVSAFLGKPLDNAGLALLSIPRLSYTTLVGQHEAVFPEFLRQCGRPPGRAWRTPPPSRFAGRGLRLGF